VESGGPSIGKVEEWCVESQHLQIYSLRLCRLSTDELAPVSKYWMYRSHADVMGPVSWCSCVITWLKPLSPTPSLSWERGEWGDPRWRPTGPVCLRSPRLLSGVGSCFILVGTNKRLAMRTTGDVWFEILRESSVKNMWCVDRVFPYMVYVTEPPWRGRSLSPKILPGDSWRSKNAQTHT
jgi:hypothetical protein